MRSEIDYRGNFKEFLKCKFLVISGESVYSFEEKSNANEMYNRLNKKYGKYGFVDMFVKYK